MWLTLALLSAVFAALTSILAKVGIEGVDSNVGTAIRTLVVFFMACGMVYITGGRMNLTGISPTPIRGVRSVSMTMARGRFVKVIIISSRLVG